MDIKKILGTLLIILGLVGLVVGIFGIFGSNLAPQSPWIYAILGLIFFSSGIGLLKSIHTKETTTD